MKNIKLFISKKLDIKINIEENYNTVNILTLTIISISD